MCCMILTGVLAEQGGICKKKIFPTIDHCLPVEHDISFRHCHDMPYMALYLYRDCGDGRCKPSAIRVETGPITVVFINVTAETTRQSAPDADS